MCAMSRTCLAHPVISKLKSMKRLKRILRVCALIFFMLLAATGMSILGVAPTLSRDGKLFAGNESKIEMAEENAAEISEPEEMKQ
jgi:hypothetical protein